jgi:hypothetical protein
MLIKLLLMFLVVYPLNWEWLIDDLFSITLLGESITVTPIGVVSYISFVGGGSFFELLFPIAPNCFFV